MAPVDVSQLASHSTRSSRKNLCGIVAGSGMAHAGDRAGAAHSIDFWPTAYRRRQFKPAVCLKYCQGFLQQILEARSKILLRLFQIQ